MKLTHQVLTGLGFRAVGSSYEHQKFKSRLRDFGDGIFMFEIYATKLRCYVSLRTVSDSLDLSRLVMVIHDVNLLKDGNKN